MEEDIKKIEEIINWLKDSSYPYDISLTRDDIQSLENIIKGYRELEKDFKILREYIVVSPNLDEMTAVAYKNIQEGAYIRGRAEEQQKAKQIIHEKYIPKSKIKEKIEEIKSRMNDDCIALHEFQRLAKIDVLQELMEEK